MSEQQKTSETAISTAFLRALSCYEDDPNIKGKDYLAEIFLPEDRRIKIKSENYRNIAKERTRAGTYEYIIARTAYFDKFFLDCLNEDFLQIVILGSGFDSRAYRFKDDINNAKIFEVDAPFTQKQKIEILNSNNISSEHINFAAVDFEKDNLADSLLNNGFDKTKKSAFIWEGVTLYLSEDAVRDTLQDVAKISLHGSVIGLDYLNFNPDKTRKIVRKDEVVRFGMDKKSMDKFMSGFGFSVIENLDQEKIANRFLKCENGEIFGEKKSTMNFLKAIYV